MKGDEGTSIDKQPCSQEGTQRETAARGHGRDHPHEGRPRETSEATHVKARQRETSRDQQRAAEATHMKGDKGRHMETCNPGTRPEHPARSEFLERNMNPCSKKKLFGAKRVFHVSCCRETSISFSSVIGNIGKHVVPMYLS